MPQSDENITKRKEKQESFEKFRILLFLNLDVPTNLKGENVEVAGQEDDLS